MHLETTENKKNIHEKTWLQLSEKWLLNIFKIIKKYQEKIKKD
jgi:hypothetical protein